MFVGLHTSTDSPIPEITERFGKGFGCFWVRLHQMPVAPIAQSTKP